MKTAAGVLAEAIRRFPSDVRYIDRDRLLIVLAEVAPSPDSQPIPSYQIQLSVFPEVRCNPLKDLRLLKSTESAVAWENVQELIRLPRPLFLSDVKHFLELQVRHPLEAALFEFPVTPPSRSPSVGLAGLMRNERSDGLGKNSSDGHARDLASRRRKLFQNYRRDVWRKHADQVDTTQRMAQTRLEQVAPSVRNALDDLLFLHPDLIALSLPFLGSPLAVCYMGVSPAAYGDPFQIYHDLYLKRLPVLAHTLAPYVLTRLTELAGQFVKSATEGEESPEQVAASFLLAAGTLLLAKSVNVPCDQEEGNVEFTDLHSDRHRRTEASFPSGATLRIDLPKTWPGSGPAEFVLPAYNLLDPFSDDLSQLESWRSDHSYRRKALDDSTKYALSSQYPSPPLAKGQEVAVTRLLSNLVASIYQIGLQRQEAAKSRATLDERTRTLDDVFDKIKRLHKEANKAIVDITSGLRLVRRHRLAELVEKLKLAIDDDKGVTDHIKLLWEKASNVSCPATKDIAHFLKQSGGYEQSIGALDTEAAQSLRIAIAERIVCLAAEKVELTPLDEEDRTLVQKALELLLASGVASQKCGNSAGRRSLLGYAAMTDSLSPGARLNSRNLLEDLWKATLDRTASEEDGVHFLGSRKCWIRLKELEISGTPPILPVLFLLALVGSWFDKPDEESSIDIRVCADGFRATISGWRRSEEPRRTLDALLASAPSEPKELSVEKFGHCAVLVSALFDLKSLETTDDGFCLTFGVEQ